VRFRFFAELEDLLTLPDDSGVVVRTFDESPSVKDQIEACGVPHTEVDLILVNGSSVGFDYRLHHGDRISVYPAFRRLEIGDLSLVRPPPLPQPRFVVDINLGKLARLLRLLGFDTVLDGTIDDPELVALASDDLRILATKDRSLLKRAAVSHGYLVREVQPLDQAVEVVHRYALRPLIKPFGRCMECNGDLRSVKKEDVDHLLEPLTRRHFDEFRQCVDCERVFWKGSHRRRLAAIVDEVLARTA
jgi:hypothetical protein